MLVDDSIVLQYLSDKNIGDISRHWIFQNIEEGKLLFETPDDANVWFCDVVVNLRVTKIIYIDGRVEWKLENTKMKIKTLGLDAE